MIITMIKNRYISYLFILSFILLTSCGDSEIEERPPRVNCGKIVRLWSQNTDYSEGNPCGDNRDYSRQFTFVVKNDLTGNEKNFCINQSVYVRYKLGSVYCEDTNLDGW